MNQFGQNHFVAPRGAFPKAGAPIAGMPKPKLTKKEMFKLQTQVIAAERLTHARRFEEAAKLLDHVAEPLAEDPKYLTVLTFFYTRTGRLDSAMTTLMKLIALDPTDSMSYANMAAIMLQLKDREAAHKFYVKSLQCDPKNATAAARHCHNSRYQADWSEWDKMPEYEKLFHVPYPNMEPGMFLPLVDDPALQKKKSEVYAKARYHQFKQNRPAPRQRNEGDKIRIGYFSADLKLHATMHLIGRMLELHDRDRFEIYIYSYTQTFDEYSQKVKDSADKFYLCKDMSDQEIVALARADEIDIAVDLKGYTQFDRVALVLQNPAPVNVSYIGFPSTLGLPGLDYIVADEHVIPAHLRKHYTEKIIYMPDCYQATNNQRPIPEADTTRSDWGLPEDAFVFASFNSHYKISPKEYDVWMRLLNQVDNSVLWIWCDEETPRANLQMEAEKRGVSKDRIIFAGEADNEAHLKRLCHADLFLDTFAVCAHTTASDAVWSALPLVTLEGQQFAARVASSILHAMEVPELVAKTPEEYEAIALDLAQNPDKIQAMRQKLVEKRTTAPLFDTERFTRNWENQLERAVLRAESGLKPDHLLP